MSLEQDFDVAFTAELALREKQVQQFYRPIIGVHKWFARRPGTLFRSLLLAEFNTPPVAESFFASHDFRGVIADPFMGGGTPLIEANRLGFHVIGADVNPMAYWIVRQELLPLDVGEFVETADEVTRDVEDEIGPLYTTRCNECSRTATVKYFVLVKTHLCPSCGANNDLFPGYLLASANRHPKHVYVCPRCNRLGEFDRRSRDEAPLVCPHCDGSIPKNGSAGRGMAVCHVCEEDFKYPDNSSGPPTHRSWAIEYHCGECKPDHAGRFFKTPDDDDRKKESEAVSKLERLKGKLNLPDDQIPDGDETKRLHRWGYERYRDMFSDRQLLSLALLQRRIQAVPNRSIREALLTVFSDFLRYQNLLCRYDSYSLKCQDIFSVHGFPVGLIQCENNVLGIPGVGSGGYRHFVRKYRKAKEYCKRPFEKRRVGDRNKKVFVTGESIEAKPTTGLPAGTERKAWLESASATELELPEASLDGVFTDPPYFANVQYAELMDFCYVWLRKGLKERRQFSDETTRNVEELTGNVTLGRGLEAFAEGISKVFRHYAGALRPGAPFVFTYHHNDPEAYAPIVVALLDAGLVSTTVHPAPAEMGASLHIAQTESAIIDSVFVARLGGDASGCRLESYDDLAAAVKVDCARLKAGGVELSRGDVRCLISGHLAADAVARLQQNWEPDSRSFDERFKRVRESLRAEEQNLVRESLVDEAMQVEPARSSELVGAQHELFGGT